MANFCCNVATDSAAFLFSRPTSGETSTADGNTTPRWAQRVDRWYQLDDASRALCEAFANFECLRPPAFVVLSRPAGCREVDTVFAGEMALSGGAARPALFVYTLPSVPLSPLLQMQDWCVAGYCFQNGAQTLLASLGHAVLQLARMASVASDSTWGLVVDLRCLGHEFEVRRFVVSSGKARAVPFENSAFDFRILNSGGPDGELLWQPHHQPSAPAPLRCDADLLDAIASSARLSHLPKCKEC
jgi:hypothetical protein